MRNLTTEKENLRKSVETLGQSAAATRELMDRIRRINSAGGIVTSLPGIAGPNHHVSFTLLLEPADTPVAVGDTLPSGNCADYVAIASPSRQDLVSIADDLVKLPNLFAVDFDAGRFNVTPEVIKKLAMSPTLSRLTITGSATSDQILQAVSELKSLENLTCECRDPIALPQLSKMVRLKLLSLQGVQITPTNIRSICAAPNIEFLAISANAVDVDALSELRTLSKLAELTVIDSPIRDRGLEIISKFPALTRLAFSGEGVTDVGLESLQSLVNLRHLHIWNELDGITDRGVRAIATMSSLESLYFDARHLTDGSVEHLRALENLRILALAHGQITGPALAQLKSLPKISAIGLHGCWINDDGIKALQEMPNLKVLDLSQVHQRRERVKDYPLPPHGVVTDAGLIALRHLTGLEVLDLAGNEVSDEGIAHLAGLRSLRYLRVNETKITSAGASKLRSLLPQAAVDH